MPEQKDLKRRVRARMQKTGESYTTARAQLVRKKRASASSSEPRSTPKVKPSDYAEVAGMSDDAVRKKTGKTWAQWVRALDRANADTMTHREIAKHVADSYEGVSGWWAQTVTVAYERIRGLREKGQQRSGTFDVNKSKTYPVALATLYRAFGARARKQWLGAATFRIKTSTVDKSMRVTWEDGTPVEIYFWAKGTSGAAPKSQVQLQHRGHPTRARADEIRTFWTERLAALGEFLSA